MKTLNRRVHLAASLFFFVAVSATTTAEAQRRGRGGLRLGAVTAPQLLAFEAVQKELKLTDEQTKRIVAIDESLNEDRTKMFAEVSKDSGERGAKLKTLNENAAKKIGAVLNDPQQQRLKEILLQVNGASSLLNDELAKKLSITEEQKDKLMEVSRANAKIRRESNTNLRGSKSPTTVKEMVEGNEAGNKKRSATMLKSAK